MKNLEELQKRFDEHLESDEEMLKWLEDYRKNHPPIKLTFFQKIQVAISQSLYKLGEYLISLSDKITEDF